MEQRRGRSGDSQHPQSVPARRYLVAKRAFDVVASALGLAVASPLMVAVAVAIRVTLGSPVLYRQTRVGRHEVPFLLFKFRTMRETVGDAGSPLPDGERLTRLGALLRRASVDELPGLWNVLRGDMSLVGPRPLLCRYLPFYTEQERLRHAVRPGMTGLAAISGRNGLGWDERLEWDVRYVANMSFLGDMRIIALSLGAVLSGRGVVVNAAGAMMDLDVERAGENGRE